MLSRLIGTALERLDHLGIVGIAAEGGRDGDGAAT